MGSHRVSEQTQSVERYFALDERGTGLRATWRPAIGLVNLSLWRDSVCVETFHLIPTEAGRLVSFLVGGLSSAVPYRPEPPRLAIVDRPDLERGVSSERTIRTAGFTDGVRRRLARRLEQLATGLRSIDGEA